MVELLNVDEKELLELELVVGIMLKLEECVLLLDDCRMLLDGEIDDSMPLVDDEPEDVGMALLVLEEMIEAIILLELDEVMEADTLVEVEEITDAGMLLELEDMVLLDILLDTGLDIDVLDIIADDELVLLQVPCIGSQFPAEQ